MPTITTEPLAGGLERTRGAEVDLAFRVRGSGPVVVMLHGTSASHAVWEPIADRLIDEATTVAVDQRGHGRSDKPATGYAAADFADDVVTVLDAVGAQTAVVVGHSLGARNAWVAAARHPDRIRGVVCVDYTPWVERRVLDVLRERVAAGDREFPEAAAVRAYLQERYPLLPADAVARRAEWGYRPTGSGGLRPLADPSALMQLIDGFHAPHESEFRAFTAPARHVRGAGSAIVSDAAWASAAAARPGDAWRVVADADHYVPEEHPGVVAEEIRRVLSAVH
ncbi:alpha/beta fold hydrolase [Microbacterium sp. NPDC089695]|uniref:alpha/beta fold hydrolase n=1 Tax=Microbacterium sp. NPDC089695 TaxID=3364198 RepID=UPI003802DEEA